MTGMPPIWRLGRGSACRNQRQAIRNECTSGPFSLARRYPGIMGRNFNKIALAFIAFAFAAAMIGDEPGPTECRDSPGLTCAGTQGAVPR